MPHVLALESIGDTYIQARRRIQRGKLKCSFNKEMKAWQLGHRETPWCAQLHGVKPDGDFRRIFVTGMKTYAESSGTGNRGVRYWFVLRDGLYEIYEHTSWQKSRRYFGRVNGDVFREVQMEEVRACLG